MAVRKFLALILALVFLFGLWLPLEFIRAHALAGLPIAFQYATMIVPILIAGAFAVTSYRRNSHGG
jgi:hypothetical protein